MLFSPLGLAACSCVIVTFFRTDNAAVALCQASETGVAIALIKTFVDLAVTVDAVNLALEIQLQLPAKVII